LLGSKNRGIPLAIGWQFVGWLVQIKSDVSCSKFELFLMEFNKKELAIKVAKARFLGKNIVLF
jgi:hypothetical protein